MSNYDFFKDLKASVEKNFHTPIKLNTDHEYYADIESKYKHIIKIMRKFAAKKNLIQKIKCTQNYILSAIQNYYSGNLEKAIEDIYSILNPLKDNKLFIGSVKESIAFKDFNHFILKNNKCPESQEYIENFLNQEVNFFKARISDSENNFLKSEMYHIPFNLRGKVSTQRFSIPGLPCIYIGSSSYICWVELGKPADNIFNLSQVNLSDSITLFNLAINLQFISECIENRDFFKKINIDYSELIDTSLVIWMLALATSYNISEKNRSFRSEYIISQLIMLNIKKMDINGISYYSKRIEETGKLNINVALFANYDKLNNLNDFKSKICNEISITDSINFGEFKQTKNIFHTSPRDFPDYINLAGKKTDYIYTEFYNFENYIFSIEQNNSH